MFCTKCGEKIYNEDKFCTKCGNKIDIKIRKSGNITFARIKQINASLVKAKVYIDGVQVASMKAGEEVKVSVTIGKHRVNFEIWSCEGHEEIEVTDEFPNIKVNWGFGKSYDFVGKKRYITDRPIIINIEKIN